jgi:hypothetical protein
MDWFQGSSDVGGGSHHHRHSSSRHDKHDSKHDSRSIFGGLGSPRHHSSRSSFFGTFPPLRTAPPNPWGVSRYTYHTIPYLRFPQQLTIHRIRHRTLLIILQALTARRVPPAHIPPSPTPSPRFDPFHEEEPSEGIHASDHATDHGRCIDAASLALRDPPTRRA